MELQGLQDQLRSKGMGGTGGPFGTGNTQTSGFSLNSGQVMGGASSVDFDFIKRQLDDL